jgi:hypothetical protein
LFRVWFQKDIKQCRSVQWRYKMFAFLPKTSTFEWKFLFNSTYTFQIIIYIYSVSGFLSFISIFWNVLIWVKYDCMHIFMHNHSLYFGIKSLRPLRRYLMLNLFDMQKWTYCNKICDNVLYFFDNTFRTILIDCLNQFPHLPDC